MGKYDGKRLLVLGSDAGSVDIIKYAKSEGAYTVVADYLPPEKSFAKTVSDKSILVSTNDIETLCRFVKEEHIDAVISGASDFNVVNTGKVCRLTGLHSYFSEVQWMNFMNKVFFRELCKKYHVSCPDTFYQGPGEKCVPEDIRSYPCIVKPSDSTANIGVSVCFDSKNICNAVKRATTASTDGNIIIEQFIDGTEVCATYVIQNGEIRLVCMGEKYPYTDKQGMKALPQAIVYPASCIDEYIKNTDQSVRRMIECEGIDNCTVFFQSIYSNHSFYVFEAGLRIAGAGTYRITSHMNGQNFLHFMVDNAFQCKTDYNISAENPTFGGKKYVLFSQLIHIGKIAEISGFDEVIRNPMIIASEQRHVIGKEIADEGTIRQIMFRYIIRADDFHQIDNLITQIQKSVSVTDSKGNEMLIKGFSPQILCLG